MKKSSVFAIKGLCVIISLIVLCTGLTGCKKEKSQAKAEIKNVLALGDSISAGYGLKDVSKECFVSIIGKSGYNVNNMAVNGNTAVGILNQFNNSENENYISKDQIKSADIITITCGGNDLMALMYKKIAEVWNTENPDKIIQPEEVLGRLASMDFSLLSSSFKLLNKENENYLVNSPEFETTVNEYIANLNAVMEYIKSVNPKAKVYVATQYNPYAEFKGKKITMIITMDLNSIYSGMEEGVTKLNAAISENAIKGGYTVVDVKTVFDSAMTKEGTDLYNADSNMKTFNVDFHPNAAGHKVIANEFIKNLK